MTTLNGCTILWDSFIQTICAWKEILQFDILWEECVQEETRIANQEVLPINYDHALATHIRRRKGKQYFKNEMHKWSYPLNKFQKNKKGDYNQKYFSSYRCYHFYKVGDIARNFPTNKEEYNRNNNKRHDAHLAAKEEEGPPKKLAKEEVEEYIL